MRVIKSPELSSDYNARYIIIDETTNKVLDDAQGYGYKTFQKALAAWNYKRKRNDRGYKEKQARIRRFIKGNKEIFEELSEGALYFWKDPGTSMYEKFKETLQDSGLVLDGFNAYELYKVWEKTGL